MATRLLLVRHGQSEWNAAGRWQGQADPPLSDLGRRQAEAAAHALSAGAATIERIWASDLKRAAATARIIAAGLGLPEVELDADLRERDAGAFSGLTRAEIDARFPNHLPDPDRPDADPRHRAFAGLRQTPPGWEPDGVLLGRAMRALRRAHDALAGGTGLAVTHGGLIYVLEGHLGAPFERLANGAGRWFVVGGDGLELGPRVLLVDEDGVPVTTPSQL